VGELTCCPSRGSDPEWCIPAVMDRLRSWRLRRSTGRASAWRAGMMALVTAGLALLLSFLFHLDLAAVAVAILGGLPTAYLTLLALPGSVRKPAYGRLVRRWNPVELGVQQVIGGGSVPVYIRRPHDRLLRAVLDPAVAASRLVVVRGGSSTGKSRAACEAVADRLARWHLDYPLDPGALAARLDPGPHGAVAGRAASVRRHRGRPGGPGPPGRSASRRRASSLGLRTWDFTG
jgi:hypothetical protein